MEQRRFEAWLKQKGYQPSTLRLTLRHTRAAFDHWGTHAGLPNGHHVVPMRRFLAFYDGQKSETRKQWGQRQSRFASAIRREYAPMLAVPNGNRGKPDFTEGQWKRLYYEVNENPEVFDDHMLKLYMLQPYRLGEFLAATVADLQEDMGKENVPKEVLARLRLAKCPPRQKAVNHLSVGRIMCPDSDKPSICAKSRLRRRLAKWAEHLGYDVDLNALKCASARRFNKF